MTPEALRRCLQLRLVDRINLSGSVISRELLDVLVSEDANSLRFVGLKHCRLRDSDVLRIALSKPSLAMDLEGNHLGKSVLDGLATQGRLISFDDMQGFSQWTQRLDATLPASDGPDMEVAKLAASKRLYGKQGDSSSSAIAANRAVRSALRFTWENRTSKLDLN